MTKKPRQKCRGTSAGDMNASTWVRVAGPQVITGLSSISALDLEGGRPIASRSRPIISFAKSKLH